MSGERVAAIGARVWGRVRVLSRGRLSDGRGAELRISSEVRLPWSSMISIIKESGSAVETRSRGNVATGMEAGRIVPDSAEMVAMTGLASLVEPMSRLYHVENFHDLSDTIFPQPSRSGP